MLTFGCIEKMNLRCVKIEDIKYPRNKITFQMKVMVLKNLMPSRFCALWNVCTLSKIRFECVSSLHWRINENPYYMGHIMPTSKFNVESVENIFETSGDFQPTIFPTQKLGSRFSIRKFFSSQAISVLF